MGRWLLLFAICLLPLQPAHAKWHQAQSDHFVIYADDSAKDIEAFGRMLERFHSAMELATGVDAAKPSPSNRVTIYIVRYVNDVRKVTNHTNRFVAGVYLPRAGASIAIVPSVRIRSVASDSSMIYLLHEYVHHFQRANSSFSMPRWMSEGSAEFFASASFEKNGDVIIGRPAQHRVGELAYAADVHVKELLDHDLYMTRLGKSGFYNAYYGKSWLLYHYLTFAPEREGQLEAYTLKLSQGKSPREAAEVFGDLGDLERALERYMRKRMSALEIKHKGISESPFTIRTLSPGEADMMQVHMRSRSGVKEEQAKELVLEARTIAARHPQDPHVLSMLAEAEHDSGNEGAAIAAADRALAIDQTQVDAYVQKGFALFAKAADADDPEQGYNEAIGPFLRLNRIENDHPLPLIYFYRSFADRNLKPSALAVSGLERAAELAPFDLGLRFMTANEQISAGKYKAARLNLKPVAYDPHGGSLADAATALLEKIADKGGTGSEETAEETGG